ncbi:sugar phosphate isomerase/epimerase [Candidatus Woesearchaeota archaeon]|nr:sugar phosphate isomerase/epimerase [Candidatus Woesearchaeota archaeon]
MVEFGTGYFHTMDRDYVHGSPSDNSTNDVGVSPGDFGMSLGLGPVPNVQAINAKLRAGTKTMEFVFTGAGKGSGQGQTPEMYGLKQRQALVEIGRANQVNFTTHATVGVYGLAGMDQQGNFSKTSKNFSLQEIKRAIEFAADVGTGGPVVVHTGEFQRPIVDADWNEQDNEWRKKFQMHSEEEGRTSFRVVDTRTGGVIQEARKNRNVSRPVWKVAQEGEKYIDFERKERIAHPTKDEPIYINYEKKQIKPKDRVPLFDAQKGVFLTKQMSWDDLVKEAEEMTKRAREEWKEHKAGKLTKEEEEDAIGTRFFHDKNITKEEQIKIRPEEAYIISTLETNAANSRGWALYYGGNFDEHVEDVKKLKLAKEFYEKLEKSASEEEREMMKKQIKSLAGGLVPADAELPTKIIDLQIQQLERQMKQAMEAASAQASQAAEARETIRHVQSAETYALNEAYDSYAQAAISTMMHSDKLQQEGKLKKPLFIAMENLFPESYGAHPDELMKLVQGSRDRMIQMLKNQGMREEEARKKSVAHINTTLDTGHLNMWRKYWIGDKDKTMKENNEEFDKWMLTKIGEMAKKKMIGHVHIDDNYGYHDDHLAPGEGNTPIVNMIRVLKQNGYDQEMIVEPGADYTTDNSGFHSVMKTWRLFGSPVYGAGSGVSSRRRKSWSDVGYGFFGQNEPPYFVFGAYSPSEEWTLWSGVPLE